MNCSVCGGELGLWAKLTAHTADGICKKCHEQGMRQMQTLVQSVTATPCFKLQYAERWALQFEETVRKYRIPESDAQPLRLTLLNNMLKLVESGDEMVEGDLKFLLDLSQKYRVQESATPELGDTLIRVGMKEIIQSWEKGDVPRKDCNSLVLQKGETCHWEEAAGLRIQRTKHEYVGGYSSVSVPVPLVRGMRVRVGGFKGHPIDHTVLEDGGAGILHITNQRVCFTGQHSVAIPYKKMISIGGFEGGFIVQTSNEKKPGIFVVRHPELTTHMLTLAANPPEEDSPTRKPSKQLPSLA